MDKKKLFDSLDGLFAYDNGCVDSGIKDELLREEVKTHLTGLSENDFRLIMTEFVNQYYTCSEAVEKGYGIEDVVGFLKWLDDYMDISL
jgi:hypothetical protein